MVRLAAVKRGYAFVEMNERGRCLLWQTRAIEAALAGIAHDIRTPLTGVVALAELLASSDLGAREREWANAIKSGADHLAALAGVVRGALCGRANAQERAQPDSRTRTPGLITAGSKAGRVKTSLTMGAKKSSGLTA